MTTTRVPVTTAGVCVEMRTCIFPEMKQDFYNSTAPFSLVTCKIIDILYDSRPEPTRRPGLWHRNPSPSDSRLFPAPKQNPGGHRLKDDRGKETAVTRWLITHVRDWYQQGMEKLILRKDARRSFGGNCVRKEWYSGRNKYEVLFHPRMALQPLLGPGLPQKAPPFFPTSSSFPPSSNC